MDITEEHTLAHELERSRGYLAEAQRLSLTGSFGWVVTSGGIVWSEETFRIFEYDPEICPTIELLIQRVHPDDRDFVRNIIEEAAKNGRDFDVEHRLLMPDKRIKYLHADALRTGGIAIAAGRAEFRGHDQEIDDEPPRCFLSVLAERHV